MGITKRYSGYYGIKCSVCRRNANAGRNIYGYGDDLSFVCDNCYKAYVKDTDHAECDSLFIRFRPAEHRRDEYCLPKYSVVDILMDMTAWILTGLALLISVILIQKLSPPDITAVLPTVIIIGAYGLITALSLIRTVCTAISGLMRGMELNRLLMIGLKTGIYTVLTIIAVIYISNRL
jgi:hypothetical protein